MSHHLEKWIEAYLDDELTANQKQRFEHHLAACADCRRQLDSQQALRTLLHSVPPAAPSRTAAQFAAEINLQLPRQQESALTSRLNQAAWLSIPLVLVFAFVFLRALGTLAGLVAVIPGSERLLSPGLMDNMLQMPSLTWLQAAINASMQWTGLNLVFQWNEITHLLALFVLGLLYVAWLVGWFARRSANQPDRA